MSGSEHGSLSFDAVLSACGSDGHRIPEYDEPLTPDETWEVLSQVHPRVMANMVTRWAEGRDKFGGSSAEHPHFREDIRRVLDNYPEGYSTDGGRQLHTDSHR